MELTELINVRRSIVIVVIVVLLYLFYKLGSIDPNTIDANGNTIATKVKVPEVFAVDLPPGFFDTIYPNYDQIDSYGRMKNKDGSYLMAETLKLPLADAYQVYQAAVSAQKGTAGIGAQFIGFGLFDDGSGHLQLGYPRQAMIDNTGMVSTSTAFNSTIPGTYTAYGVKNKPATALLYGIKPDQGEIYKIAGVDCKIYPWYSPPLLSQDESVYSFNV